MSWPVVQLSEVAQINPRLPKNIDGSQIVSFVAMASAGEDGMLLNEEPRILAETKKGFTYFERGDVLLAKITPCFENGKCLRPSQIRNQIGFGSTEFHVLRANAELLDADYLFYMIWSKQFRFLGEKSMSGAAGQKRVSADFLKSFEIPLPPLEEQKRIATILDKADAIRRKRQQAIQLADEFLRAVFLEMFGDIEFNGWGVTTVEHMAARERGSMRTGPFGSDLRHSEFIDHGIAVLGIDNAVKNKFSWGKERFISLEKYEQLKRYTVKPGDVLITIMGTCGRCVVVPNDIPLAINTKHLCCITLDKERCLPSFLHAYFLMHPVARNYLGRTAKGAIMDGLNIGMIKDMPIPLVPIEQQARYEVLVREASNLAANSHDDLELLEKNFLSLSQKAFLGDI